MTSTTTFPDMTVYVVDDDANMRKALVRLFTQHGLSVLSFESAAELLESVDQNSLGCLVLDIVMPNITGLELQKQLNAKAINLPTIVLTGQADVPITVQAFKQGAVELIEKPFDNTELLEAIVNALKGLQQKRGNQQERLKMLSLLKSLTSRENEVLNGIMDSQSNKEIAKLLSISPRTIETHRNNIMRKMEASSAVDLAHRINISKTVV